MEPTAITFTPPASASSATLGHRGIALRLTGLLALLCAGLSLAMAWLDQSWIASFATIVAVGLVVLGHSLPDRPALASHASSIGLLSLVALLLWQSHGQLEMQFLFFAALLALSLFQDWSCIWSGVAALFVLPPLLTFAASEGWSPIESFGAGKILANAGAHLFAAGLSSYCAFWLRDSSRRNERLQAELETANRQLQSEVEARKDAEAAIRAAMTELEKASVAKGEFLANVSHEIRTPMNSILGTAEMMLELPQSSEEATMTKTVINACENLVRIVNDILDFSRIEAGQIELEIAPFSLVELVQTTLSTSQSIADRKGIALDCDFSATVEEAYLGEPFRIRQILTNLVDNALKFTDRGIVRVAVSAKPASDGSGKQLVSISVSDTGIGIEKSAQEMLFQKFTQADSSTSRRFGGTGLGLSICKSLAELMGGSIELDSIVGLGSRFTVHIPLRPTDAVNIAHPDDDSQYAAGYFRGLRVLVAEDYPPNYEVIRMMMNFYGCSFDWAKDGRAAVDMCLAAKQPYDLVFMDIQMPVLDGIEATRAIREAGLRTPIVALTANVLKSEVDRCFAAGMNDLVSKPVRKREIAEIMDRWTLHVGPTDDAMLDDEAIDLQFEPFPMPPPERAPNPSVPPDSPQSESADVVRAKAALDEMTHTYGATMAAELAATFRISLRHSIRLLDCALQAGELGYLRQEAHKLKGSLAYLEASDLVETMLALETAAKSGESAQSLALAADALAAVQHFERDLDRWAGNAAPIRFFLAKTQTPETDLLARIAQFFGWVVQPVDRAGISPQPMSLQGDFFVGKADACPQTISPNGTRKRIDPQDIEAFDFPKTVDASLDDLATARNTLEAALQSAREESPAR